MSRRMGYGVRSSLVAPDGEVLRFQAMKALRPSYDPSYRMALLEFVRAVQAGSPPGASLDDGLRNLRLVLECEQSSREGRAFELASD